MNALTAKNNLGLLGNAMRLRNELMEYRPLSEVTSYTPSVGQMARFGIDATPFVGDAKALEDAKIAYQQGRPGLAAFNAATAIPVLGDIATVAKVTLPTALSLGGLYGMMRRGESLSEALGPIARQRGVIGGFNPYALESYLKSQVKGQKAKRLPEELKDLRAEIRLKREARSAARPKYQIPIEYRLLDYKKENALEGRINKVTTNPNAQFWAKNDIDKIKQSVRIDGDTYQEIKKANLKGIIRELKKNGWDVTHTSKYQGRVSSYYPEKNGVRIRISDHDLPETAERAYNQGMGLGGGWTQDIVIDESTDINDILRQLDND